MSTDFGLDAEQVSPENLKRLADIHLRRYRSMLQRSLLGDVGLRTGELRTYVAIWEGVELKKYLWRNLADEERSEIYDAVQSGE